MLYFIYSGKASLEFRALRQNLGNTVEYKRKTIKYLDE